MAQELDMFQMYVILATQFLLLPLTVWKPGFFSNDLQLLIQRSLMYVSKYSFDLLPTPKNTIDDNSGEFITQF